MYMYMDGKHAIPGCVRESVGIGWTPTVGIRAEEVGHTFINVRSHMPFTALNYIPHCIPACNLLAMQRG